VFEITGSGFSTRKTLGYLVVAFGRLNLSKSHSVKVCTQRREGTCSHSDMRTVSNSRKQLSIQRRRLARS
jgi:hypothetical protein